MKISKQTVLYAVLGISLAVNAYVIGAIGYYSYEIRSIGKDTTWIEKRLDRGEEKFLSHLEGDDKAVARRVIGERTPPLARSLYRFAGSQKVGDYNLEN